jgi:glycosyltransferase involved in cell wall biosynthesis
MPFFSIIVPVYNRAGEVARALRSCLAQTFTDFEVVLVDDGSTDDSVAVIRSFDDPRIRLIVHEQNRGRCPARNTAMAAARGQWFIFFDSDDELLPHALEVIHRDAVDAPESVNMLRYMCKDPQGVLSPEPPYVRETWTYERYIRALEESIRGEALPASRTSTFPAVAFPEGHAEEALYHLDLGLLGMSMTSPEVVRIYHQDAPNQITKPDFRRALRFAADNARNVDVILERHGEALRVHAPTVYASRLREGALYHFMNGDRRAALRYARESIRARGLSPKLILIVLLGLVGGAPLAWFQTQQGRMRRAFAR